MGWLLGWSHRKTVTITGQSGAGTNYQVNLSIGDASGGDFHLENHCTSFPNDITVTDNDQTTLLDHWVEDLTVDPISMWVEVADDLGSNVDVCIYYDKTGESSASNISNTFIFGDDFPGSSLDTTNKWTVYSGTTPSVSGGIMTMQTTDSKVHSQSYWNGYSSSIAVEMRINHNNSRAIGVSKKDGGDMDYSNYIAIDGFHGHFRAEYNNDSWEGGTPTENTWLNFKIIWTTSDVYFYENGVEKAHKISSIPNYDAWIYFRTYALDSSPLIQADWVLVRKYQSTEPAFSSAGAEESAPSAGVGCLVYGGLVNDGLAHGRLVA